MTKDDLLSSRAYREWRETMKFQWAAVNAPCALCGQRTINYATYGEPDSFEMDHKKSRKRRPDLAMDPGNVQPSHKRCNGNKAAGDAKVELGELDMAY